MAELGVLQLIDEVVAESGLDRRGVLQMEPQRLVDIAQERGLGSRVADLIMPEVVQTLTGSKE